jgi:superfamily I DNA/RNA helicase/RecB family exonuclease
VATTRFTSAALQPRDAAELDLSQRAVLQAPVSQSAVVLGAPGTGKTTSLVELLAHRVAQGLSPDAVVVLTSSRQAANRLRDRLASRLEIATNGALARTPMSLAFALASEKALLDGLAVPRLLTGSEQDQIFAEMLAGDLADRAGPNWPSTLSPEVRSSRVFRTELRELYARCVDALHSSPGENLPSLLRELGLKTQRPEWVAAGDFWANYLATVSEAKTNYFDSSEFLAIATQALGDPLTMPQTQLVLVDDAQELTYGAANMLRAFVQRQVPVVLFGDPDVASTTFRGAVPNLLGQATTSLGAPFQTHVLAHVHRHNSAIRLAVSRVTERIGTASAGTQRRAASLTPVSPDSASVTLIERTSRSAEWSAVARILREHHIFHGVPFSKMAVVVRNGGLVPQLARSLAVNEVPSRTLISDRSLRDQPIVRALITVVDVALGRSPLTLATANELLLSAVGGLSVLDLRRLRLSLRHEELLAGGTRTGEELLPDALAAEGRLATIDSRPARRAARFSQLLQETRVAGEAGASIEELLWCVWEGSKLSGPWASDALGSGLVADDANRNLDSVMALFTSAKRFVEREPHRPAADFISELLAADIPEDTLAPQSLGQSVLVCTPTALVGAEYDVIVVASLQEGIWPNLRLRGSLLHPQDIVEAAFETPAENVDDRRQVVEDELRMFALSLSRAQAHIVVSATRDEDSLPSPFFRLLASIVVPAPDSANEPGWVIDQGRSSEIPLSLRGLVGSLRRSLVTSVATPTNPETPSSAGSAASLSGALAALARAEVPGADPAHWYGLRGPSTTEPLVNFEVEPDAQVKVSPSKLEAWENNQLDWFISSTVGNQSSSAMGVGSLFHSVIEAVGRDQMTALDPQALWQPIQDRWHELAFDAPWESMREQRRAFKMMGALSSYLTEFKDSGAEVVAVECEFTVPVGHAKLHGFIDRIEKDVDGNIVIVDLKTGGLPGGTNAENHAQLLCYQFALVNEGVESVVSGGRTGGARLLYLRGKEKSAAAQGETPLGNQPFTYKVLNQSPLRSEAEAEAESEAGATHEGVDEVTANSLESVAKRIADAADGMAGQSFTAVVYTREERGQYDSRYESRIHVIKAVSA